jgi:DNA-binding GntR family transcriptional regulator
MEVRMESKKGAVVSGIDPVLAEIQQRLQAHPKEWLKALEQNPSGFANLEQEIHRTFAQMADRVVAGLLAQATAASTFADVAQKK